MHKSKLMYTYIYALVYTQYINDLTTKLTHCVKNKIKVKKIYKIAITN